MGPDAREEDRRADVRRELAETREQLAATSEVLAVLGTSGAGRDEVFDAIVERARRLCRADVAQIYTVHGDVFALARSVGMTPEFVTLAHRKPVLRDRTSLIGRISLDATTQQIVDVLADPDYDRPEFQRLGGYRSIVGAPMIVEGEVVGVLSAWRTSVDPFEERVCDLLTTFAVQGALALRNVGLFDEIERRSQELARKVDQLEALREVGEALSSSLDPDEVLATIVAHAVELSGTDGGSLMELDEEAARFRVRTTYGTAPEVVERLRTARISLDGTLVGRSAVAGGGVTQVADLATVALDPHLQVLADDGWRSIAVVPLTRSDRVVGALVVRRRAPGVLSDEVCQLLTTFANQSATALTNARLYRQLELQSRALERASRHKSEFLASMSHELRTPLNAVIGFSEVLLERMFGDLNERQEDYLQDILGAGRHLLALLGDILDLSKVEAGQMELDRTWFDVGDAVGEATALVRERALQHGQRLVADLARDAGAVSADELRFKQVLVNLLTNAVKFTPDGGEIRVAVRREAGAVEVTVTDTGVGVDADEQARIFDTFEQGGRPAGRAEGTGLGLAVCKRIVELHGGLIWVRSAPGEGSTFGFRLPQPSGAHDVPPPRRAGAAERTGPAAGVRAEVAGDGSAEDARPVVLVIEDDDVSAELVSLHVEAAGMRALRAATGEEGLVLARTAAPVAVVLDIRLPGLDGWDVLTRLKSFPGTAHVPVLVVSVLPERGRGFALGAADYLLKPVAREQLLRTLRRVVDDPGPRPPRRRVLVVDDDPDALELVRVTLEPRGWDVVTCADGSLAPDLAREHRPGVVLVDLLMPGTDGFAVVDALRSHPSTASTPVVVLTAATLSTAQRDRLRGRIEFVAAKSRLDLVALESRLAGLVPGGSP